MRRLAADRARRDRPPRTASESLQVSEWKASANAARRPSARPLPNRKGAHLVPPLQRPVTAAPGVRRSGRTLHRPLHGRPGPSTGCPGGAAPDDDADRRPRHRRPSERRSAFGPRRRPADRLRLSGRLADLAAPDTHRVPRVADRSRRRCESGPPGGERLDPTAAGQLVLLELVPLLRVQLQLLGLLRPVLREPALGVAILRRILAVSDGSEVNARERPADAGLSSCANGHVARGCAPW